MVLNNISIVSHIKNEIEFLEQFWKHIHTYSPREIIILDTGSTDGTWELLMSYEKNPDIIYIIEKFPHYTGQVFIFNKVVNMATSEWVIKLDADELLLRKTQQLIFDVIKNDEYNCISIPTIHHCINSNIFFNCIKDNPDYHQRIFKKSVFNINSDTHSKNHGSILWNYDFKMLTLDFNHPLYHYSFLRSFKKIQKRSIINYYIDIKKITDYKFLENLETNTEHFINKFSQENISVTPAWQLKHTLVRFNDLSVYYVKQFLLLGEYSQFKKPEDLIVNRISDWWGIDEFIKIKQYTEDEI